MINISIKKAYRDYASQAIILENARKILAYLNYDSEIELNISIDSDKALQKLNNEFLGYNQPTDVLSFESNEIDPETGRLTLGDIVISYPAAERQALEAGHPVINEIILLIIHGILHLSGFDHVSADEKKEMWQKQQSILDFLSIRILRISGDDNFHD